MAEKVEGDYLWPHETGSPEYHGYEAVYGITPAYREVHVRELMRYIGSIRSPLINLLARVHRDGGHHTGKVGVLQACLDAEEVYLALRAVIEELEGAAKT